MQKISDHADFLEFEENNAIILSFFFRKIRMILIIEILNETSCKEKHGDEGM